MLTSEVMQIATNIGIQPREYQSRIISNTYNSFNEGIKSILIVSPTGSGKTICSLLIAKVMERQNPNIRIIWSAMRHKLLLQAEKENQKIGVKNIQYVSIFNKNPPEGDLLIGDEFHHSATDSYISFRNKTQAKLELGMTGTPIRTDKLKLVHERTISDYGVRFLIEQGYLSRFDAYTIPEFSVQEVAKHYLESPEEWGQSIFFMRDYEECYALEKFFKDANIKYGLVLGTMSLTEQDEKLNAAEEGDIKVLINVNLLVEGYDSPKLQTVWIRDNAKLPVIQQAGRVLRKDPKNPNKIARIVQSSDTKYRYAKSEQNPKGTAKARREFIFTENGWLALEAGPQVRTAIQNVMRMHAGALI